MENIYARLTQARKVSKDVAQLFVEENHSALSANPNSPIVSVGLYYGDMLVAVAQFCTPRTPKKKEMYSTELLRLCFKQNYRISGGASKLVKYYISTYNPVDIFTYQDTTGENTNVYENCGFSLVSQEKEKRYLIAPGKTLKTAGRKEKLSMAFAAKLGPDNILGTALGEVFKENGERKTNVDLFLDLGWKIEKTTGDKTYEWVNPDITFYCYKITATDSKKYYFGYSHIKKNGATKQDCKNDGYYGSGGKMSTHNKFANWKKKHAKTLKKEILGIYPRRSQALKAEKALIGELWANDPNCLNSMPGGVYTGLSGNKIEPTYKECAIHGKTKHLGDKCCKCTSVKSISVKECAIHGRCKHIGDKCRKCINDKNVSMKSCSTHGLVKHIGEQCYACRASAATLKHCEKHGETFFNGDICLKCRGTSHVTEQKCEKHGLTAHMYNNCMACNSAASINIKECPRHGLTKHRANACCQCTVDDTNHGKFHLNAKSGKPLKTNPKCYLCQGEIASGFREKDETLSGEKRECPLCSLLFTPKSKQQIFCSNPHSVNCEKCGKSFMATPRKGKTIYKHRKKCT